MAAQDRLLIGDSQALIAIVEELAEELRQGTIRRAGLSLSSSLDRDVGLDSLGRMELLARIERRLGVHLPEQIAVEAQTIGDLLQALQSAAEKGSEKGSEPFSNDKPTDGNEAWAEKGSDPFSAQTLVEVLRWHVATHPDRTHITLLSGDDREEGMSYRELFEEAETTAAALQYRGLKPKEAVVLMLPTARAYFSSFFGVLLAGGVPVPIYPPARMNQLEDHFKRHRTLLQNCQAAMLITIAEARGFARLFQAQCDTLRAVVTTDDLAARHGHCDTPPITAEDIAFLQYTSGSTGNPKGVVLTHANLLANIRASGRALQADSTDVFVSWLPLYHDMGLIGAWFGTLYHATRLVIMSPLLFLARPQRWLWAMHRYRGTLSAAPNFAYELCLRRLLDRDLEGLDLGAWRTALNGAEPVNPNTVRRFCERFAPYGFRREAMAPVYGLAEATLALAMPPLGRGPIIDRIEREAFMNEGVAVEAGPTAPTIGFSGNVLEFMACGQPLPAHEVRIVDDGGRELPERREGRLQFRGPSATAGYFRSPAATRALIQSGWVTPGDLAYIARGEVYITGRTQDIVIRAGRNIYPHELEEAVGELPGVRRGRVAVFGSPDPQSGTERLVVVVETNELQDEARERLRVLVNALASDLVGGPPDDLVLAPSGTVLKTSSGKIRRGACRELYEAGAIGRRQPPAWRQVARLMVATVRPALRRARRGLKSVAYGVYCWSLFALLAPIVWTLVVLLPRRTWRFGAMRMAARFLARAALTPCTVQGAALLPPEGTPVVLCANHASILDAYYLVGFLPRPVSFVAKAELGRDFSARLFLSRIGTEFVERFDKQKGVADARRIAATLRRASTLLFFPEGTFSRIPGLLPFHMGAFVAAAEHGAVVVPVVMRGTRYIFRDGNWIPTPGPVRIEIGAAIDPRALEAEAGGDAWKTALLLRTRTREYLLAHCEEPDLAHESL
ncbi:MAG: AMP-binding protein [Pseudomonadota bacterium]|nr:AMP-binding protein [Pseudomonadota bacterium]